ncbi:hypothetical protein L249_4150 [Ophiocordyceps polyrhachis-furcata BCC 54312]|uniref:Uncharacterized protein n=1 Tax=Ophiocordyceps polyrhachis-furcata BCC 54312 TaxID=1330021 RepID=A0A367L5U2_9HYPO|nr:hypothetical protein L249_4150 [Ophiocordyceps polyrhachis-furcata BCC 54312]
MPGAKPVVSIPGRSSAPGPTFMPDDIEPVVSIPGRSSAPGPTFMPDDIEVPTCICTGKPKKTMSDASPAPLQRRERDWLNSGDVVEGKATIRKPLLSTTLLPLGTGPQSVVQPSMREEG